MVELWHSASFLCQEENKSFSCCIKDVWGLYVNEVPTMTISYLRCYTGTIIRSVNSTYKRYSCKTIQFSEDIVPLSDLKVNLGKIINRAKDSHRPILLTSRGRGVAVVQGLAEYENLEEERAFMKAITQGLVDIKEGKEQSLDVIKKKLGLKI